MKFDEWYMERQPEQPYTNSLLEELWNAAIASEREDCAKICDVFVRNAWAPFDDRAREVVARIAKEIRDGNLLLEKKCNTFIASKLFLETVTEKVNGDNSPT